MRNNGLVNDWNTVVEQLLTAHPKVVKKKKKKVIKKKEQKDDKNAQIKILVERIEEDQQHRQKILEDHSLLESQMSHMNNQLEGEKEKTRKTLKLAYLLRLEIAKQKTMIAEQQSVIQGSDAKIDTVKVDMQNHVKEEVKDVREELKKFQEIFLEQQRLMREMQEGTVADVKDTRSMLHDVQKQTLELIELQKAHEALLTEKLTEIEREQRDQADLAAQQAEQIAADIVEREQQQKRKTPTPEPYVQSSSSSSSVSALSTPRSVTVVAEPEAQLPTHNIGAQVLARMPDDGNDGWFYRVTITEHNGSDYRVNPVESSEGLIDIKAGDIVPLTPIDVDLQKEDTVIASHPHYQATYAPGVIVKEALEENQFQVRFYDGTEGIIRKSETHQVDPERFEAIVDEIISLEQRWINEKVIARDDTCGIYRIGTVKDRIGSGHEYLIEWTSHPGQKCAVQHLTCIFGQFSKRRTLTKGDHVLARNNDAMEYYPGVIVDITSDKRLEICLSNGSTTMAAVNESFWISKEYYHLAREYIDANEDSVCSVSSTSSIEST